MESGWSWSGFERSATFVRSGEAYRNLAPVLGTDQVSDGRAIAAGDLDGDGDLDLVGTSSRTHPHVQVLRNDVRSPGDHLFVDLRPADGRSAVGARVLLRASGSWDASAAQEERTWRRDVTLGNGLLAQSDPTLHFGLGGADEVRALEIRWPDGTRQELGPQPSNCRVVVRQGEPAVGRAAHRPHNYNATYRLPTIAWDDEGDRWQLVTETPRPDLSGIRFQDLDGEEHSLVAGPEGWEEDGPALLVNLWATWCSNCRRELPKLASLHAESPEGIRVLGISLDEESDRAQVVEVRRQQELPYPIAHPEGAGRRRLLDLMQEITGSESDLTLPISLLLNPNGRVIALAQGGLHAESLAQLVRESRRQFAQR